MKDINCLPSSLPKPCHDHHHPSSFTKLKKMNSFSRGHSIGPKSFMLVGWPSILQISLKFQFYKLFRVVVPFSDFLFDIDFIFFTLTLAILVITKLVVFIKVPFQNQYKFHFLIFNWINMYLIKLKPMVWLIFIYLLVFDMTCPDVGGPICTLMCVCSCDRG